MLKKFIKFLNIKHSMAFSKNSPDLKKKYENIDDVSFPFLSFIILFLLILEVDFEFLNSFNN